MQFIDYYAAQLNQPASALLGLMSFRFDGTDYSVVNWAPSLGAAPTPAQLAAVVALPDPAPTQAQLVAYAQAKQAAILAGGYSASVGASAPVQISTDATSLMWLQRALSTSGQSPSMTFQWAQRDGATVLTLTSAQVQAAAAAEGAWEQSVRSAYAAVATEIAAGAITMTAEIDAYSWPANS